MGKRKKSSRKPTGPRKKERLEDTFTCIFCHHDKSISVKIDKKDGVANLLCKICGQAYATRVHALNEAVDVYHEWIDEADRAEKDDASVKKPVASDDRGPRRAPSVDSPRASVDSNEGDED